MLKRGKHSRRVIKEAAILVDIGIGIGNTASGTVPLNPRPEGLQLADEYMGKSIVDNTKLSYISAIFKMRNWFEENGYMHCIEKEESKRIDAEKCLVMPIRVEHYDAYLDYFGHLTKPYLLINENGEEEEKTSIFINIIKAKECT